MSETLFKLVRYAINAGSGTDWTSPTYVYNDDTSRATCGMAVFGASKYLRCTDFDFSGIPDGSTINGIEAKYERYGSVAALIQGYMQLVLDGVQKGSQKTDPTAFPISETAATLGGASDLWGWTAITAADVKDSGFGVDIAVINLDEENARTAYIDVVWIKVHYTAPAGGGSAKSRGAIIG